MIDVIIPIYFNYNLIYYQFMCWRNIKGDYRLLICDNTPLHLSQEIIIPDDFKHKALLFRNNSEGIDGERHGGVIDYMVKQSTSDIICIQDSDFFWLDVDIFEYILRYFKNGYKCVGTDLYYPAFEKVNSIYPERHSCLAPCVFGMFIDRKLALSETFVVTQYEGHNEFKETGWRMRKKIIDENIKTIIFPAIQHPEQKNFNVNNSNVPWFYVGNQKFLGVHLFGGTSYNINHTDILFEKIYKLFT